MSTNSKKSRLRQHRKFFIKENDDISIVSANYFANITKHDAVNIGVQTYLELQQQMVRDAVAGREHRLGSIPIVEGLQRSLTTLEKMYPFLMSEIFSVQRRMSGQRVYTT